MAWAVGLGFARSLPNITGTGLLREKQEVSILCGKLGEGAKEEGCVMHSSACHVTGLFWGGKRPRKQNKKRWGMSREPGGL